LINIRKERPEDIEAIRMVNQKAFAQSQEGRIVDALRENGGVLLSLVATINGRVVGHILYSPVSVSHAGGQVSGAGLGPMSVLPEFQRQGIGSRLVEEGIQRLRERGCPFVGVLGHPGYYPRFGFKPASGYGIGCEWDVPDEAFMLLVMDEARMEGVSGVVVYRGSFRVF
jgi:putative acetyltransferase